MYWCRVIGRYFMSMILQLLEVSEWVVEYFIAYSRAVPLQANRHIYDHIRAALFTQRECESQVKLIKRAEPERPQHRCTRS